MITAVFGVSVTRVTTNRTACYQIYCEQREEDVDEQVEIPPAVLHRIVCAIALPKSCVEQPLDHSLFQRPPPLASL